MLMCAIVWVNVTCAHASGDQKSPEPFRARVIGGLSTSHLMWVLEMKLGSTGRATSALNCWAFPPAQKEVNKIIANGKDLNKLDQSEYWRRDSSE